MKFRRGQRMSPRNRGKAGPHSSAVLAQLLDAEGWTDHVANQVEGWWRRAKIEKDFSEIDRLKRGISAISERLTEDERRVLGKFIGLHMRMGFDTGLRMGLAVRIVPRSGIEQIGAPDSEGDLP